MVEATCVTELDDARNERWPKAFVAMPRVGDLVESATGRVLVVASVTHRMREPNIAERGRGPFPVIRVELH